MTTRPDFLVIGSGVVGASITYHLAKAGAKVSLVERERPGSRTSKVSFGWINAVGKRPEHYHRFSRKGVEAYTSLEEDLGHSASLGRGGTLQWPAKGPGGQEAIQTRANELERLAYPFSLLTLQEAAELEPNVLVKGIEGPILYMPTERWADGDRLAGALADRAQERGASVVAPCSVREVVDRGEQVEGVLTSDGYLMAGTVVVAAGTASVGLLAPLGYSLPLGRVAGALVVTSPAAGVIHRVLYPGTYHVRPMWQGQVAIGSRAFDLLVDEDTDTSAPPAWADRLLAMAQQDIGGLENAQVEQLRVGARPMPQDGLPIIGPVPGIGRAYVAVMHSGVTLAAIVGQTIAEELVSGQPLTILEPYRPTRFPPPIIGSFSTLSP